METMTDQMPNRHKYHWIKKIVFLIIVILLIGYWFCGPSIWMSTMAKGYQAVFLTNGQVYFGKISASGKWIKLTDIYYLQVTQPLQQASSGDQNTPAAPANPQQPPKIQLIKLGSELHGPSDVMYIEKDKVIFWENMKDDSKVVQAINQQKAE